MKSALYTMCVLFFLTNPVFAQFDILKKIEKKVEEKVEEELDKDKKAEEETKEKEKTSDVNNEQKPEDNTSSTETSAPKTALKSYSKFDFVPGEKIIFYDDFTQDNIGDFPQRWNTNGTGEVVTLNNYPGRWFKLKNSSTFLPYYQTNSYGENFTIEFDLLVDVEANSNPGALYIDLYKTENINDVPQTSSGPYDPGAFLSMHLASDPVHYQIHNVFAEGQSTKSGGINNSLNDDSYKGGQINRVSIAVNKQRYRLYINDRKVFDLPRMMGPGESFNSISFRTWGWNENKEYNILLSNFRIAEGQQATQSKLVTEGRFVTRGILFDSGSDKIKPESYGTLKDIASVLKENSGIKVQIIGHTDSDGEDKSNMDLSQRRAASVKEALSSEFGIDNTRLETSGKGESEPAGPNDSAEGKANNRRVEFVKL